MFESVNDRKYFRFQYDSQILNADEGMTVLYSSSENQSSDDSPNGGVFLCTLLRCVELWKTEPKSSVLNMADIMGLAINNISRFYPDSDQIPSMKPEKRRVNFPFAVKLVNLYS